MKLALKVDVDTYDGIRVGVPNLLKLFKELNIHASFFIPFGPDESGKAIFRIFKKKGFLKKMFRTNALKLYGIKTALRGTLLPAPMIGSSFPEIARKVLDDGHELGIHGYNHVLWQDHLLQMEEKQIREQFELGISAYEKIVGQKPKAFAAPAWLCFPLSLKMLDDYDFHYASDTRGWSPFYPSMSGQKFKTLQIPSTLPTIDEVLGTNQLNELIVHDYFTQQMEKSNSQLHVHTIHTEGEGTVFLNPFSAWLNDLKKKGFSFTTLSEIAESVLKEPQKIPRCKVLLSEISGRSGQVSCQKHD